MNQISKTLHTGKTRTAGGRDSGASRSFDGLLDIRLSTPGSARIGTNPEQLLAAGWSASFADAIAIAARKRNIMFLARVSIEAEVDLNLGENGYFLGVRLNVMIPGLGREVAAELTDEARNLCPYSKATRGNVEVRVTLI
ncbi:Ohr family peroxiredoxin [Bradyrhizobium sp.]|jgi:osmotically inducible protein OsmC|uniref:Ohr family peroxiredoxin n=1 Tax=Bradyrhizobium sp. TaxID=376 RepID=UPI003C2677F6